MVSSVEALPQDEQENRTDLDRAVELMRAGMKKLVPGSPDTRQN